MKRLDARVRDPRARQPAARRRGRHPEPGGTLITQATKFWLSQPKVSSEPLLTSYAVSYGG